MSTNSSEKNTLKLISLGIGTLVVLGGFAYGLPSPMFGLSSPTSEQSSPKPAPSCDSKEARDMLFDLSFEAYMKSKQLNPGRTTMLYFYRPTELDYDIETGTRSCMASVHERIMNPGENFVPSRDTGGKIGFTIERNPENSKKLTLKTVPLEFLKARIASKSETNKNLGAPVGRDAIRATVMEGLRNIDKNLANRMPSYRNRRSGYDTLKTYEESVSNVLTTADCRELDEGRYGCPIQIEYRDNLLGAVGASPWKLLKGEFVFVREGDGWKVDDGFSKTFMEAVVRSRFGIDSAEDGQQPESKHSQE